MQFFEKLHFFDSRFLQILLNFVGSFSFFPKNFFCVKKFRIFATDCWTYKKKTTWNTR